MKTIISYITNAIYTESTLSDKASSCLFGVARMARSWGFVSNRLKNPHLGRFLLDN